MLTKVFVFLFLIIYFTLNTIIGIYLISWSYTISIIFFVLLSLANIEVSFSLTELIFALALKKTDLPILNELNHQPSVALLYVTCNDFMPELVKKLSRQTYKKCDVFILDDSDNEEIQQEVDKCQFNIIRRNSRNGNKAGNLNNWLKLFGNKYKYFLVMDSDSILPADFLEKMLRYAEHPDNKRVALFQSKLKIWNLKNAFPKLMASCIPIQISIWERILTRANMIPLGNNCLYRTESIIRISGFPEEFTAEDLATGIELIENGYQCKLVDVVSYETIPESLNSYSRRNIRWATQTLEVVLRREGNVPFLTKLYILSFVYKSLIWFNILALMLLAVWSYNSSFADLAYLINVTASGAIIDTPLFRPLLILSLYWSYFLFSRTPLIIRSKISCFRFYKYLVLNLAVELYNVFPLLFAIIKTFLGEKVRFTVTDKRNVQTSFPKIAREMNLSLFFIGFLSIGIIRNPVSLLLNFIWFVPYVFSPLILYKTQRGSANLNQRINYEK